MNPELQRYLWLEMTVHRLVATPVVLGLVFALIYAVRGFDDGATFEYPGWVLAAILGVLVGSRAAVDAVTGEIRDGTWDQQRLSSVGPWSMSWAKLLGAPMFSWYMVLPCLVLMVLGASVRMPPAAALGHAGLLVAIIVLAHAVSLLVSLHRAASGPRAAGRVAGGLQYLGLLVVLPALASAWSGLRDGWQGTAEWFGLRLDPQVFVTGSVLAFAAWTVIGCHRLMRRELKLRNGPWVWVAFSLWLIAWVTGFAWSDGTWAGRSFEARLPVLSAAAPVVAHLTGLALGFFALISEPKDPVVVRRLLADLRAGALVRALEGLPRWVWTLPIGVATLAWMRSADVGVTLGPSSLLFFLRDAGLVALLNLAPDRTRADLAAMLYLVVLYVLLPGLIEAAAGVSTAGWLRPALAGASLAAVVSPALQAAALWLLVVLRWRRDWSVTAPAR